MTSDRDRLWDMVEYAGRVTAHAATMTVRGLRSTPTFYFTPGLPFERRAHQAIPSVDWRGARRSRKFSHMTTAFSTSMC